MSEPIEWRRMAPYLRDFGVFFIMLVVALISLIASCTQWQGSSDWLQRSGSLIVVLAAILEYRHLQLYEKDVFQQSILAGSFVNQPLLLAMSKTRHQIGKHAIYPLLFGTVIWGYGDIPFAIGT